MLNVQLGSSTNSKKHSNRRTNRRKVLLVESLEARQLLSISTANFFPTATGIVNVYSSTVVGGATATITQTIAGPATYNGHSGTERDSVTAISTNNEASVGKDYFGFTSDGWVSYGNVTTVKDSGGNVLSTDTTTNTPDLVGLPSTVVAGTTYTSTVTASDAFQAAGQPTPTTSTSTDSVALVLSSESLQSVTAGTHTYNAYMFTSTDTTTPTIGGSPTVTTTQEWIVPGIGLVKEITDTAESRSDIHHRNRHRGWRRRRGGGGGAQAARHP